jgi:hypothetical protein
LKETFNPIHAVKYVEESEVSIVHILALSYAIKENANLASIREL